MSRRSVAAWFALSPAEKMWLLVILAIFAIGIVSRALYLTAQHADLHQDPLPAGPVE